MDRRAVMSWTTYVCVCALLVVVAFPGPAEPCSPLSVDQNTFSPAQKSYLYDSAVMGRVTDTEPDQRFDYGSGTTVYTATLQVYCIFKGPRVPQFIDIPEAGFIPGHCVNHVLEVGSDYIVLLRPETSQDDDTVVYRLGMVINATHDNPDNFSASCGLEIQPPEGTDGSDPAVDNCPIPAPPDQCEPRQFFDMNPVGPPAGPPPADKMGSSAIATRLQYFLTFLIPFTVILHQ